MFQKLFIIGCFLFSSIGVFSQDADSVERKSEVPSSIYVKNDNSYFLNTLFVDDLKLKDFKFLIFDDESLMSNSFTIDLRNFGRRATNFSSQTYKDFDLYKHFPVVPDIMILHRFNNNKTIEAN